MVDKVKNIFRLIKDGENITISDTRPASPSTKVACQSSSRKNEPVRSSLDSSGSPPRVAGANSRLARLRNVLYGNISRHFFKGGIVRLYHGEVVGGGDGEADGADAGIEVENFVGGDVLLDFLEGKLVDGEVDLEEAIGRIRILVAEDSIGKGRELGMRLAVDVEAARDLAGLIAAEK